ncbi:MAG: nucleoside kinase [Thermotogae bacterium]|uniref:Nucleoside kinase n=1 Tax=Kosmotoga arenicorallina TaxID=688066 RepID=A0A7C5HYK4_9BACT|nr:nucleoside kinase [Kosmotoga sp.]MBO8167057.1 nucleoside kinase [Kosmotoga sp.]RKX47974.1 MAG: nucleoside kinase [Thermotogota bacterium]HHF08592.1 nucleoside kinase [Kosmotoga arenicorallina]
MKQIKVKVKKLNEEEFFPEGITLAEIAKFYRDRFVSPIMAARLNNSVAELIKKIYQDVEIEFVDLRDRDGLRIYTRGILFVLFMAVRQLYGKVKLYVHHSLGSGLVCEVPDLKKGNLDLGAIESEMQKIIELNLPFIKETINKFDAIKLFLEDNQREKAILFKYRKKSTVNIYRCGEYFNYYYGYMPTSTGDLRWFKLLPYKNRYFILNLPTNSSPTEVPDFLDRPKLANVFMEHENWGRILGVKTVGELNSIIASGDSETAELIRIAEALHEKKIANIADEIAKREGTRLILIAGPSSSGKTTFSKRLMLHLKVLGFRPIQISLDDYFVDREKTPKDENGNYDFESIEALNLELFNEQMNQLMEGKEVHLASFNFKTGKGGFRSTPTKINEDQPIIVEGIHGLNEQLSRGVPSQKKFKIYVSALTQMNLDDMNRIPTTDVRLLRRIVRDYRYRGHSALDTIKMWGNVRNGEEKYIFPFQEQADVMFNSALVYELAVLKMFAEPLLLQIDNSEPEFAEAKRLLRFIDYFLPITAMEEIPRTSLLREFIGGSTFRY